MKNSGDAIGKPYQQGALDCLCSVYAICNAIRISSAPSVRMTRADAADLFNTLIAAIDQQGYLMAAVTYGIYSGRHSQLLHVASDWAEDRFGIELRHRKPFHKRPEVSFTTIHQALDDHLAHPGTSAIIGTEEHWSVVNAVTPKRILLFDSAGSRWYATRSFQRGNSDDGNPRHRIIPTALYLLRISK